MVYQRRIANAAVYKTRLKSVVDSLLKMLQQVYPAIFKKVKIHYLRHFLENIERHGLPVYYATEQFEAFNGTIRSALFQTNRQNPSRDLANRFAIYDGMSFMVSGTYIKHAISYTHARGILERQRHLSKVWP